MRNRAQDFLVVIVFSLCLGYFDGNKHACDQNTNKSNAQHRIHGYVRVPLCFCLLFVIETLYNLHESHSCLDGLS